MTSNLVAKIGQDRLPADTINYKLNKFFSLKISRYAIENDD